MSQPPSEHVPIPGGPIARLAEASVRAVVDPNAWSEVARFAARHLEVDALGVAACDPSTEPEVLAATGIDRTALLDLVRVASRARPSDAGGDEPSAVHYLRHVPGRTLSFQWAWWLPGGVCPSLAWAARHDAVPDDAEALRLRLAEITHLIVPAVDGHLRLRRAERRSSDLQEIIDHMAVGAVVTDEDGRVIASNRAARRAIESRGPLVLESGVLRASDGDTTRRLQAALAACRQSGSTRALRIDPHGIELLMAGIGGSPPRTVVFLMPASHAAVVNEVHLHGLYKLTGAEIRLVAQLLEGRSLSEAASELGISRNTAHTQLQSVFTKTRTHRQADLIALILRGPAALHREPSGSHRIPDDD